MHTLVAVASRLLAIYLVLVAFRYSSYVFFAWDFTDSLPTILGIFTLGVAIPILAAIFLWHKSAFVARILLPKYSVEKISVNLPEEALFTVLVTVLGFYLVITGGAALAGSVAEHHAMTTSTNELASVSPSYWGPFVRSTLELVLGLVLLLRLKGLTRIYFFLKEGGLREKVDPNHGFNRTPESSGPPKPGDSSGGAG